MSHSKVKTSTAVISNSPGPSSFILPEAVVLGAGVDGIRELRGGLSKISDDRLSAIQSPRTVKEAPRLRNNMRAEQEKSLVKRKVLAHAKDELVLFNVEEVPLGVLDPSPAFDLGNQREQKAFCGSHKATIDDPWCVGKDAKYLERITHLSSD